MIDTTGPKGSTIQLLRPRREEQWYRQAPRLVLYAGTGVR
jgi:hypothetical protein